METTPLIQLSHVGMRWSRNTALRDVNLTINRGDFMAVTGPNGGGKTTLLRIILKLQKPSTGSVAYFRDGREVATLPIGYLPQKNLIDSRFPITVEEVITSGLTAVDIPKTQTRRLVDDTLATVGLEEKRHSPIGDLSGGQLQRTLLGRAIISSPGLLVLDEPLSYVDKHFEHRIYDIIGRLAPSTTILLVSHEMSTIASMANRHLIVDRTIHECTAAHHIVHYECDDCDTSLGM